MAGPTSVINRPEFGATFEEFGLAMDRRRFAGPALFKPRLVGSQAGQIGRVPVEALLARRDTTRAPHAAYSRSDFEFEMVDFKCQERGAKEPMDDRLIKQYRDVLDCESVHSRRAVDAIARAFECDCADAAYDTSVWTGAALTTAITIPWSTAETAVPIKNIEDARKLILAGSGMAPDTLVCNREQFFALKNCHQIQDLLKYSGDVDPSKIGPLALASVLDLDHVVVAGGHENLGADGAIASISPIWSNSYCMLAKTAQTDDWQEPAVGRAILWNEENAGVGDGTEISILVEEYREENRRGSVIRARADWHILVLTPQCAHLLSNIL
ncbi:MAG: hypothetical protein NTW96_25685 [Planctomycetia bacterium]|nr:hypothetical protein [Planctomycetia bacterium]